MMRMSDVGRGIRIRMKVRRDVGANGRRTWDVGLRTYVLGLRIGTWVLGLWT